MTEPRDAGGLDAAYWQRELLRAHRFPASAHARVLAELAIGAALEAFDKALDNGIAALEVRRALAEMRRADG